MAPSYYLTKCWIIISEVLFVQLKSILQVILILLTPDMNF